MQETKEAKPNKMILGKNVETGENVELDLKRLIRTRLLIQANSGGGKSWCGRRIMEQTHKEVQHIIIDTEGEFATLREKYDYLLVGSDGEIPATIKTAELLPKKIMDMKLSVIIDLSEMSKSEKCSYIKKFVDALLRLPREYWKPLLIFIDEAHDFAPEASAGKAESKSAIIGLGSKGRKRRWAVVLMTQRSAKLSNDASAECNNKLTGLANIPTDRKKAADDLGFTTKDEERKLRELEPGEMYGYGSAISRQVIKIKIGPIFTTHEEEDGEISAPAKTPENVKKLLKNFIDLPKEAEKELQDKKDFIEKINEQKSEIRRLKLSQPKPVADEKAIERARLEGERNMKTQLNKERGEFSYSLKQAKIVYDKLKKGVEQIVANCSKLLQIEMPDVSTSTSTPLYPSSTHPVPIQKPDTIRHHQSPIVAAIPVEVFPEIKDASRDDGEIQLGLCAKKLYSFLAYKSERKFTRSQLGAATGYRVTSGGFKNAISQLKTANLIEGSTELQAIVVDESLMGNFDFSIQAIINSLGKCEREIFEVLMSNPTREFGYEELAAETPTNYSPTSGGYKNALSRLKTLGLIEKDGTIKLHEEMLEII